MENLSTHGLNQSSANPLELKPCQTVAYVEYEYLDTGCWYHSTIGSLTSSQPDELSALGALGQSAHNGCKCGLLDTLSFRNVSSYR